MTAGDFKDHFSDAAGAYGAFRPRYPDALFAFLAECAPGRGRAWDCGCGSGQASVGLAPYFDEVVATDASARQVEQAEPHPKIRYRAAPAEASGLPEASVDLVLSAQAAHWFDLDAFYAEVRRVAKPGGVTALAVYGLMTLGPDLDPIIGRFYGETVGPFWPPERAHVDAAYRTLPFPFEEQEWPAFAMTADWPLAHLAGFFSTWSAVRRYRAARGADPVPELVEALRPQWGPEERPRRIAWPIGLRLGLVAPA
jgi:SAM-dependent methyltransferase